MSYSSEVLADTPLGYWRLGEAVTNGGVAADSSGNGRNGAYNTGPGPATSVTGLLVGDTDTAVSFAGGLMRVGSNPALDVPAITVEAVIKPSAASLSGNQPIATRWVNGTIGQRWILWLSSGKLQGLVFSTGNGSATGATTLVAGQVYHVAMTFDGATIRVYLNGVQDGSAAFAAAISTGGSGPMLDVARVSDVTTGTVTVDELAFYSRALSQTRLAEHYAAAVASSPYGSAVLADTPLAYWRLGDRAAGLVAGDSANVAGTSPLTYQAPVTSATSLLPGGDDAAVTFTDTNSYASVSPAGASLNSFAGRVLSVELWVKFATFTAGDHHLVGCKNGSADRFYLIRRHSDGGGLRLGWYNAGYHDHALTAGLQTGTTYHLVLTADGTNVRLYVNGALSSTVAEDAAGVVPWSSVDRWVVGRDNNLISTGSGVQGVMDEVALYATALSPTRVAAHYAAAAAAAAPATTGTLAATLPSFSATLAGTSTAPAVTGTVAATLPPFATALAGTSTPPATTGTVAATLPPFSATLAGTYVPGAAAVLAATLPPFGATLAGTSTALSVPPVTGTLAAALATFVVDLAGNAVTSGPTIYGTDTTYANDSYTYGGTAQVDYDTPVAPPPPGLVRRDVRRVHQSLPTPDLVRGRPQ